MAAYGVGLIFDAVYRYFSWDSKGSVSAKLVYGFLAALPVAYVLVFLALLAGHFAVFEQTPNGVGRWCFSVPASPRLAFP